MQKPAASAAIGRSPPRTAHAIGTSNPWIFIKQASWITLALLLALLAWDASGLDLVVAQWAGTPQGFALQNNRVFVLAFHELPRMVSMALVALLLVGVAVPWGFIKGLPLSDRAQIALSVLGAIALSTAIKRLSDTSCPWDLQQFGGTVPYVSHWALGISDGGNGHCFPAGHASAAFGFVAAWFVLRRVRPRWANRWLAVAVASGFVLGIAQQWRGAHFMSHTLWAGFICWSFGLAWEFLRALSNQWKGSTVCLPLLGESDSRPAGDSVHPVQPNLQSVIVIDDRY